MASAGESLARYGDESHSVFIVIEEGDTISFMK